MNEDEDFQLWLKLSREYSLAYKGGLQIGLKDLIKSLHGALGEQDALKITGGVALNTGVDHVDSMKRTIETKTCAKETAQGGLAVYKFYHKEFEFLMIGDRRVNMPHRWFKIPYMIAIGDLEHNNIHEGATGTHSILWDGRYGVGRSKKGFQKHNTEILVAHEVGPDGRYLNSY